LYGSVGDWLFAAMLVLALLPVVWLRR